MWKRAIAVTTLSLIAYSYRHRIIRAIEHRATPFNEHITQWKRDARVIGLMHLCGNRPQFKDA